MVLLFVKVAPYCASKWAIEGLTRSVAKELPVGMAIVALSPGVVNTDMLQSCFGASASLYQTPEAWSVTFIFSFFFFFPSFLFIDQFSSFLDFLFVIWQSDPLLQLDIKFLATMQTTPSLDNT